MSNASRRAAWLAPALLLACGGGGRSAGPAEPFVADGACLNAATGECQAYRMSPAALEAARQSCSAGGWGTFRASCPAENRLGTCGVETEAGRIELAWYPGWMTTVAETRDACALMQGTFTPGPGVAPAASSRRFACDRTQPDDPTEFPVFPSGACTEVAAEMTAELVSALQFYCGYYGGTPLAPGAACPTTGRVGTCRTSHLRGLPLDARYYDAQGSRAACSAQGGSWTDG